METPAEARMRRYNLFWWGAFVSNIFFGALNAASGGFWQMVAWLHVAAAIAMIVSRKRFHKRMLAMGVDVNGRAIPRSGQPK